MSRSKRKGKVILKRIIQKSVYDETNKYPVSTYIRFNENGGIIDTDINGTCYSISNDLNNLHSPKLDLYDNSYLWEYTKERDCVFLAQSVGDTLKIYNGHEWIEFYITNDILFHQFGKFAYTRKRCIYKNKKKKKKQH